MVPLSRPSRTSVRTLVAALLLAMGATLPVFLLGALAVQVKDELDPISTSLGLGAMVSAFFVATAIGSMFAGRRIDLLGWRKSARISAIANVALLLGIALFARSWATLFPFMIVAGIVNAIARPTSNRALANEVAPHRQAITFGLLQSAMPGAGLLAGLSVPTIALSLGWRWAFVIFAAVPLVALFAARGPSRAGAAPAQPPPPAPTGTAKAPLRRIPMVLVVGITIFAATAVTALMTFLVVAAVEIGISEASAGLLLAAGNVIAILVRVLVGWRTDHRQSSGLIPIAGLLAGGGLGTLVMSLGSESLFIVGALLAFAAGTGWPGLLFFVVVRQSGAQPALATSRVQLGLAIGAIGSPLIFSALVVQTSYSGAWAAMAGMFGSAALLALAGAAGLRLPERALTRAERSVSSAARSPWSRRPKLEEQ